MPKQERIELLRKQIKTLDNQVSFAGWLLIVSLIAVPVSVFSGSKILGASAISFLAGNFIAVCAFAAKQEQDKLESMIIKIQLMDGLESKAQEQGDAKGVSAGYGFDPIGLN